MDRLTEMEAFATVVDQGGFTDAARKMGISKSAVSKHISSLETRLGARLLNRTTRRVSPTEIGLAYYDRARRVLTMRARQMHWSVQCNRHQLGCYVCRLQLTLALCICPLCWVIFWRNFQMCP